MSEPAFDAARFTFSRTVIEGVLEVSFLPLPDHRGAFARVFDQEEFALAGHFSQGAVQVNLAMTSEAGTARGLHWQEIDSDGRGESKLIACVAGRVFDVAVDVRPDSPTYLKHHAVELVPTDWRALLLPPGVAHGMQALESASALLYHHSARFNPSLERGLRIDDPLLAIEWPLPIRNLSERDRALPFLSATT